MTVPRSGAHAFYKALAGLAAAAAGWPRFPDVTLFSDARVVTDNWGKPSYLLAAAASGDMWASVVAVREQLMQLGCRVVARHVASHQGERDRGEPQHELTGASIFGNELREALSLERCRGPAAARSIWSTR